jgi:hypothetical protein
MDAKPERSTEMHEARELDNQLAAASDAPPHCSDFSKSPNLSLDGPIVAELKNPKKPSHFLEERLNAFRSAILCATGPSRHLVEEQLEAIAAFSEAIRDGSAWTIDGETIRQHELAGATSWLFAAGFSATICRPRAITDGALP